MYQNLLKAMRKPTLYAEQTNAILWNDDHISKQMLKHHLDPVDEAASRNHQFVQDSIDFISRQTSITKKSSVIDFGCGPGLYTSAFAKLGADVTGLDFSSNSIKYAREQAQKESLEINYIETDYLKYKPTLKHDLATLIYCDYCALSDQGRHQLLKNIYDSLKENGLFILDVHTIARFDTLKSTKKIDHYPEGGFFSASPHFVLSATHLYTDAATSLDLYTIVDEKEWYVFNWLKHFDYDRLRSELKQAGFEVLEYFSDLTGRPFSEDSHDMALIARRL